MKQLRRYYVHFALIAAFVFAGFWGMAQNRAAQTGAQDAGFSAPTVILDAGHGGEDGGASTADGVPESAINLAITLRANAVFRLLGYDTVLIRSDDRSVYSAGARTLSEKKVSDIKNRVALVESTPDALLVSIHQNTFPEAKYSGAQVFSAPTEGSARLAELAQGLLCASVDPDNHRKSRQIPQSVYLMNHISCPAILAECGFLSNEREAAALQTPGYQTKLAMALAAAVNAYTKECMQGGKV